MYNIIFKSLRWRPNRGSFNIKHKSLFGRHQCIIGIKFTQVYSYQVYQILKIFLAYNNP